MAYDIYDASIPPLIHMLGGLSTILSKGEAHGGIDIGERAERRLPHGGLKRSLHRLSCAQLAMPDRCRQVGRIALHESNYFGSSIIFGTSKVPALISARLASIAASASAGATPFTKTISLPPSFIRP